jgi:hypothetical protein
VVRYRLGCTGSRQLALRSSPLTVAPDLQTQTRVDTRARVAKRAVFRTSFRKLATLPPWIPILLAVVLVVGVLTPITHTSFRGDDAVVETILAGARKAQHVSIPHQIVDQVRQELDQEGRLQPIGGVVGDYYAAAFQGRFAYKAGLALLTLACLLLLAVFLRMYRVGTSTLLIVAVAFGLSLQFRGVHDPALGYYAGFQFILLTFFAALIAYLRFVRGGSRWWYAAALLLIVVLLETYEGTYPFVLAFAALHTGRDPARTRSWRYAWPVLGLGAAVTLLAAYLHTHTTVAPGVSGYATSLNVIAVAQTEMRETVSGIPNIYFASGAQGLLDSPTKAEILGAAWRAGLAALLVLIAFLMARREPERPTTRDDHVASSVGEPFGAVQIALVGVVLVVGSGLVIALAKQWQEYIQLGTGHLATLADTLGYVLIAAAAWIHWRRRLASYPAVIGVALVVVFGMMLAGQYSNLRVAAFEQPGIQQRELLQAALQRGVLDDLKAGATVQVTGRDMNWSSLGNLLYPGALDYFTYLNTGRKFDVEMYGPPAVPCGTPPGFPDPHCTTPSSQSALLAVRASKGGGVVILAQGFSTATVGTAPVRRIVVLARGASARGGKPELIGSAAGGRPWSAGLTAWIRVRLAGGWARYTAMLSGRSGPVAPSLTDTRSLVNFDAPVPAGQLVRWFGTKNLLP